MSSLATFSGEVPHAAIALWASIICNRRIGIRICTANWDQDQHALRDQDQHARRDLDHHARRIRISMLGGIRLSILVGTRIGMLTRIRISVIGGIRISMASLDQDQHAKRNQV
jgi:hypothetical protein